MATSSAEQRFQSLRYRGFFGRRPPSQQSKDVNLLATGASSPEGRPLMSHNVK